VDKVAEKYTHEREGLGNAGPPFEWKPDPLPDQVQSLLQDLDGFAAAPGGQQKDKLAELGPLVSEASAQVKKLVDEDLPALNKKMNDAGIPHIVPKPAGPRRDDGNFDESLRRAFSMAVRRACPKNFGGVEFLRTLREWTRARTRAEA
jgi:hypothetical protein